ncbi:MAG: alpha-L-arabinofuranosidase [Actinobacteria bacterium HGW-Actinobacteria-4]|nr:MAG: alpha-L-arabinofuranosidase [Actinobacteria bacterium HGW-Actinobacteria-4]
MTQPIEASIALDPAHTVAPVSRRTFGSFVEHLGRCVYTGIFEPGHPSADADGIRTDVADLVRELGVSSIRYPGGNFVSGYRWEDGVGPVAERPARLDLAWHTTESNRFGTNEFLRWAATQGVEPMMAVNLGTRGIQEALDLLEYCNIPGGTALSDLRRAHGFAAPHKVRMWCLGNEMDGPWQVGHKTATEYGRLAAETARAMRLIDSDLELVACGSSGSAMPTFGEWEATVLEHTYNEVDFISAHAYYEEKGGDLASFLASAVDMDGFIEGVISAADHVRAVKKASKRINISFDEWNVWYMDRPESDIPKHSWPEAPRLLEDVYCAADAVVVGSLLISLLRRSDRVTAASLAQLVNVIAPIMTEPGGDAWRQTTFYPFALTSALAKGDVLRVMPVSPVHATERFGDVSALDAVATWDADAGAGVVFAVNRHPSSPMELSIDARGLGTVAGATATLVHDDDPKARNTQAQPDRVLPREVPVTVDGSRLTLSLPAVSWAAVQVRV